MGTPKPGARALAAWAAVSCTAAALAAFVLASSADARQGPAGAAELERGGQLYQRWCAVCHATDGGGTGSGPPINDLPLALVDLTMRTGAMPKTDKDRGVRGRTFTDGERRAALTYMVVQFGLDGAVAEPGPGDPGRGQGPYTVHCAQCHGASGEGGVAGSGTPVPRTRGLDAMLIAQAVRTGPMQMPAFHAEQLDDDALDDVVAFLQDQPSRSPLGLGELTRLAAFAWALLLGVVILGACWWISSRPVRAPDADLAGERRPKGPAS